MDNDLTFTLDGDFESGAPFMHIVGNWMIEKDEELGVNVLTLTQKKMSSDGVNYTAIDLVQKYTYVLTPSTLELTEVVNGTVIAFTKK